MYEILYTSVSSAHLSHLELMKILDDSRLRNEQKGISGMLVYCNREFMQILEGNKKVVQDLYQTIAKDNRHVSVEMFYEGPIKHRSFSKWSMAFKELDQDSAEVLVLEVEKPDNQTSLISMVKDSQNRGKDTFLRLLDSL